MFIFFLLQETATLEAKTFELEQRVQFAAEAKTVLDSWVRYEAQVKQRQQKELAESLIAKVKKELENPKNLQQVLQQSVAEVESMFTPTTLPPKKLQLPQNEKRKISNMNCSSPTGIVAQKA